MSLVHTVLPTDLPLQLEDVKLRLKIDANDQDGDVAMLIRAATGYVQNYQWSQLIASTVVQRLDRFPCGEIIYLHKNPVSSVTTVQYVDSAGVTQTLVVTTDYTVDLNSKPARIIPAYAKSWPSSRGYIDDVIVTYVAGYGATPETVPEEIRQAMYMLIAHWHRNTEGVLVGSISRELEFGVKALLDLNSYRVFY